MILFRGRWRSFSSLSRYLQQWESALLTNHIDHLLSPIIHACESNIIGVMDVSSYSPS
jgi:hypothetical protein